MLECVILVDNSNLFIEGQKQSTRQRDFSSFDANIPTPSDPSWRIAFGQLLVVLANGRPIRSAILVGSRPPSNDSVWESAEEKGFEVIVHDRSGNKEKAVNTELVGDIVKIGV